MIAVIIFRPIIIIVLLVVSVVFVLQNQQPVALVFFGTKTIQLSLAIWVLIFAGAGVLTSLFLQLLFRASGRRTISEGQAIPSPEPVAPPRTAGGVRDLFGQKREQVSDFKPFSVGSSSSQEWERGNTDNEWDIETPPTQPTPIREELRDFEPNFPSQAQTSSFEVERQPKTTTRQGSVYSYSYREAKPSDSSTETKPSENPSSDQVYDANYRVLNTPQRENPPESRIEEDEDEDWV